MLMPVEQKQIMLNGDEAVAYAVKQCDVDVVSAFPITPQTIIVERLSEYKFNGEVDFEFIPVESEHSAMSALVGASAAGARCFTATSSQGLLLMNEILWIAASLRLPIVMAIASRAVSGPINIHCDHTDVMSTRDTGWVILITENVQEAYDTAIQAFKIAEHPDVLLPVLFVLDGFVVSHTAENLWVIKNDEDVHRFLGGPRKVPKIKIMGKEVEFSLNPKNPVPLTFGPFDMFDWYFEHKVSQFAAYENVPRVVKQVNEEYGQLTGRKYGNGVIETYQMEDAEIAAVIMGSGAGTAKDVIDEMREEGIKIGLVRIRLYRPFPAEDVLRALRNTKVVGVFDRAQHGGAIGGPLFLDIRSTLYDLDKKPIVVNYIYGLGGRDLTASLVRTAFDELVEIAKGVKKPFVMKYLGVRGE